ncbi:hypothetical protein [Spirosoma sp.]|uniref:hypothetical protein n=1 Tax=Spirosoma sp. TaxID=1899569 RepID=UPI00095E8182|nr:hypothetical protein [Spirosoma sp.]MBN8820829.1 hypothetical protein [Spirosoma sp.]OJW71573.1 MAG: hypothetical protein BGO59_26720 [Spirosoma sp. 48-14]
MKILFYICLIGSLLCAQIQPTFAQEKRPVKPLFAKGDWQLGLKVGHGPSPLLGTRNTTQLAAGYYIVNGLLLGLTSSYTTELAEPVLHKNVLSAGPLIRYQFISGRLSPYTESAYQLGRRSTEMEQSLSFTLGLSVGLVAGLRLDLGYNFQYIKSNYFQGGADQTHIGINYLFRSKQ